MDICIRDGRDVRGRRCGNIKVGDTFASVPPRLIVTLHDERMIEFFDRRLAGEPVPLPRSTT